MQRIHSRSSVGFFLEAQLEVMGFEADCHDLRSNGDKPYCSSIPLADSSFPCKTSSLRVAQSAGIGRSKNYVPPAEPQIAHWGRIRRPGADHRWANILPLRHSTKQRPLLDIIRRFCLFGASFKNLILLIRHGTGLR